MNIGIITTWFERGAAYVSKTYMNLMTELGHNVLIYARGGDAHPDKKSLMWNESYVTRDDKYFNDTQINKSKFFNWIRKNHLELVLFNEQRHFKIVALTKKKFPSLKIGAYIDYYKEDTIGLYNIYDFVICNTKRHFDTMSKHPQTYYLKWGVDTDLYKRKETTSFEKPIFFHSVGMSKRKGTDVLINAFINGELFKTSKLIIHTQIPIENVCQFNKEELAKYNIEVIDKTVTAPGLYGLGNVYVYPTRLDGLGLTLYEALSFGMPVITTDYPPMNEVINNQNGSLVKVKDHYCRSDAYYYPMSICDEEDLIAKMQEYVDDVTLIKSKGEYAREYCLKEFSLETMRNNLKTILECVHTNPINKNLYTVIIKKYCNPIISALKTISESNNFLRKIKYRK